MATEGKALKNVVGRWTCLVCMSVNLAFVPVNWFFGQPVMVALDVAMAAMCGATAWAWQAWA